MPALSPFQTLPLHIAEAIGRYCSGLQRHLTEDPFEANDKLEDTWLMLHDVSRSWMQLARRNLNKSVYLQLSKYPHYDGFATTLFPRPVIERRASIIPHVKEASIHFEDIIEEPSEYDLEELDGVWPDDLVFPKARVLTCILRAKHTQISDNARNDKCFRWVMERVRSSFPNLHEIKLPFDGQGNISISSGVLFSKDWNASLFISALFRIGRWVIREPGDSASITNDNILMHNAPELTSFRYSNCLNDRFSSWVIQKSAKALEKLHYHGGFRDFLFDDDGRVIVYPRLRDLYVFDRNDDKSELTTDKSIVPFPVLQHLEVSSRCVFKDDTLFRGSGDTLISLDIGLHRGFVDIFREYKVFSQDTYRNVLHISATRDDRAGLTLPVGEFTEVAFRLASSATQSMSIQGDVLYSHISSAIPTCPYLENIQVLILDDTELSLLEVLDIFKYFPRMTDFGCCFRGIDSELNATQGNLIPSHLGTLHSQLNSRLKCWHAYYSGDTSDEDMAVLFVTLAVLCPNFTFVRELGWYSDKDDNRIGYILSSGLYDQHAKRLGKLFALS